MCHDGGQTHLDAHTQPHSPSNVSGHTMHHVGGHTGQITIENVSFCRMPWRTWTH